MLPALDNRWIDVAYSLFGETGLIFGGLMTAILLGWCRPGLGRRELNDGFAHPRTIGAWILLMRFVATPMLAVLLVQSLLHLPQTVAPLLEG
jgi:SNF family Na+-dependent transporter